MVKNTLLVNIWRENSYDQQKYENMKELTIGWQSVQIEIGVESTILNVWLILAFVSYFKNKTTKRRFGNERKGILQNQQLTLKKIMKKIVTNIG